MKVGVFVCVCVRVCVCLCECCELSNIKSSGSFINVTEAEASKNKSVDIYTTTHTTIVNSTTYRTNRNGKLKRVSRQISFSPPN